MSLVRYDPEQSLAVYHAPEVVERRMRQADDDLARMHMLVRQHALRTVAVMKAVARLEELTHLYTGGMLHGLALLEPLHLLMLDLQAALNQRADDPKLGEVKTDE